MKIIRIEHADGWGMFRSCSERSDISDLHKCEINALIKRHSNMPSPWGEELDMCRDSKDWFCGFKSIEEFRKWVMPEEVKILTQYDYKVWLIEAEEVQLGEYQVIFTKESITEKKDITSLF